MTYSNEVKWTHISRGSGEKIPDVSKFGVSDAKAALSFHESFPEYSVTPLVPLSSLAESLGLGDIFVKDESFRFSLNAFKVLGGSYAIGRILAKKLGLDNVSLSYAQLVSENARLLSDRMTFVTATDGNHGRGVAWTANKLNSRCIVYLPKGSSKERLVNIRSLGADASITELSYDDAVRLAMNVADKNGFTVVQDTSWDGYEEIPADIMRGYLTMALESVRQLDGKKPTHVFLQAGVGAMAGALTAFFADYYGNERPIITIVEPHSASCIYETALARDGRLQFVTGEMNSIMAGLCCGEPCALGWDVLRDRADFFLSIPDHIAADGMRALYYPTGSDRRIISGESGACTLGTVAEIMRSDALRPLRTELGLNNNSRVLCFSTEGDTDKENFRKIVFENAYSGDLPAF